MENELNLDLTLSLTYNPRPSPTTTAPAPLGRPARASTRVRRHAKNPDSKNSPQLPRASTRVRRGHSPPHRNPDLRSLTITPPRAWATEKRAKVHSLSYLVSMKIFTITGDVVCKRCEKKDVIEYDLVEKFQQLSNYVLENKDAMAERAPTVWMSPVLPNCRFCNQESCMKPEFPPHKRMINWLFLLLGQMLGCCTLEQLKWFCKHTENHRTGAKDRLVYSTYMVLCKQLDPTGPYDR